MELGRECHSRMKEFDRVVRAGSSKNARVSNFLMAARNSVIVAPHLTQEENKAVLNAAVEAFGKFCQDVKLETVNKLSLSPFAEGCSDLMETLRQHLEVSANDVPAVANLPIAAYEG